MLRKKNNPSTTAEPVVAATTTSTASAASTAPAAASFSLLGVAGGAVQASAPQKKQSPAQIRMMKGFQKYISTFADH